MRTVDAEARDAKERHEGGHAVVFIAGLDDIGPDVRFHIRPLGDAPPGGLGNLAGEHRAVAVEPRDDGLELLVGPAVTEHPALVAGSMVEIEIADAAVRAELLWPAITPSQRKRPRILGRRGDTARSVATAAAGDVPVRPQVIVPPATAPSRPASEPVPAVAEAARRSAGPVPAEPGADIARATMLRGRPPAQSAPVGPRGVSREAFETGAQAPAAAGAMHSAEAQRPADYVTFYPHARGGMLKPAGTAGSLGLGERLGPSARAAAIAIACLLTLQGAIWMVLGGSASGSADGRAAVAAPRADGSLYDILAAGPISPRGVEARSVPPARALENAQAAFLVPGGVRDPEEGAFWLRRYVSQAGADERTRRALTQLGTALADGSNRQGDVVRARVVWELAGALGDPVAMCFLSTLAESGLGGVPDRAQAVLWLERARAAGGCPGLDEAMLRLKP